MKKERIKIGWAEADITPAGKCELYGQYYQRVSNGIHSRLGATALAIKSESGEHAVMISVDLTNFRPDFLDELRKRVKRAVPAIVSEKIVLNATHTHSAPAVTMGAIDWYAPKRDTLKAKDYREFVLTRLTDAVRRAWGGLAEGAICAARATAVIGHCRRAVYATGLAEMYGDTSRDDFLALEGNEDSTVELLFTYDGNKKATGVIVNVACPSQVMEATYLVSSDYMGELRRLLKVRFGEDFKTLCQISSAGCQSPRDLARNRNAEFWSPRGVAVLGQRLADAVLKAQDRIEPKAISNKIVMAHCVRRITLPKWLPGYGEMIAAKKEVARLEAILSSKKAYAAFVAEVKRNEKIPDRSGPYDSKLHHFVLIRNAAAVIKRWSERDNLRDFEMELHTLRLGDAALCTNPFELFLDYGLRIKARSRAGQTFVIQLCCGSAGYLPTATAEKHGGYGGLIINGAVGSDGGAKLVDETLADLNALFA